MTRRAGRNAARKRTERAEMLRTNPPSGQEMVLTTRTRSDIERHFCPLAASRSRVSARSPDLGAAFVPARRLVGVRSGRQIPKVVLG
jgi:hypothetical protein